MKRVLRFLLAGVLASALFAAFPHEVFHRLEALNDQAQAGQFDQAIDIIVTCLAGQGVVHAFGTGHSEAFAKEIAGRAGGFIPTNQIALIDLTLLGTRDKSIIADDTLERDPDVADELYDLYDIRPGDALIIASNSGANGSVVGLALRAKAEGLPVIAVTSLAHSQGVTSKHTSGKRLFEVADVVIDNMAPYGDATLELTQGMKIGAVSSITAAFIAQMLTVGAAEKLKETGTIPPMYLSANIPGGDEHNNVLVDQYGLRIKPRKRLLPSA